MMRLSAMGLRVGLALVLALAGCTASTADPSPAPSQLANQPVTQIKAASEMPLKTPVPGGKPGMLDFFYIGKRRSVMEPCGCHSKQQGGVQHEATLYKQRANVPAIRVDNGEWATIGVADKPIDAIKTRFLLRAMGKFPLDAVNVGYADMQLSAAYFKDYAAKNPDAKVNFVSANIFLKNQPAQHAFPASRIVQRRLADGGDLRVGLTGVTFFRTADVPTLEKDPKAQPATQVTSDSFLARRPQDCLKPVLDDLRPKVDLLVVLNAGDFASSVELAKAFPQIDVIVANASFAEPSTRSFRSGNTLILSVQNYVGKELGLAKLQRDAASKMQIVGQAESLAVGKSVPVDEDFEKIIIAFKKATQSLEVPLPGPNVKQIYASSDRCIVCHAKEYASWRTTRHSHALQTLIDTNQQFNPDCLKCHTTGFRQENGFYSVTHPASLALTNVQCEVCHGPALEHADIRNKIASSADKWMPPAEYQAMLKRGKEILPRKQVPEAVCLKCHTPENDGHFVYKEKIGKVNHSPVKQ